MLRVNNLTGFGGEADVSKLVYISSVNSLADSASYSANFDFGPKAASRIAVVAVTVDSVALGNTTVTALTVGGVAATKLVEATNANGALSSLLSVDLAAAGEGSLAVNVTLSQGMQNCTIHAWRGVNVSATPTSTNSDTTGNPSSFNMNCPANSMTVCSLCVDATGAGTITWTNQVERYDSPSETSIHSVADSAQRVANASLAVSANHSGGGTIHMLVGAVFQGTGQVSEV